ncbi:hypothetical protein D3C74_218370 [compost metagenome]
MTKQARDWQEDMPHCAHGKTPFNYCADCHVNQLQETLVKVKGEASAEKERADKAEKRMERHVDLLEKWNDQLTEHESRIRVAEAREKKLREAIEDTIDVFRLDGSNYRADTLEQLLASLYPEEEEDKVTKREELMKQIKGYSMWPPKEKIEQMTDEELERYIDTVDLAFKAAFEEDEA